MSDDTYPAVDPSPRLPALEAEVIERWKRDDTYERSIEQRAGGPVFTFFDGPPFANGRPHYGHLLTGAVKDAIPRFKTMQGFVVDRTFGWDCHGLPAEMAASKALGVAGRAEVEALGVGAFNAACRSLVEGVVDDWTTYVERQARWVDLEGAYRTMDLTFMESVMWGVKRLHERGLLFEGHRVLPYCVDCGTPLSNFETRLDDSYRERVDPAVTVAFRLETGQALWAWTTTPWTVPSNVAIAVGADIDYTVLRAPDGDEVVLATDRVEAYAAELADHDPVATLSGSDLVGLRYEPVFPFLADTPGGFRVLPSDHVTTVEGTGAVHMAPGFGEADQDVCAAAGIPVACPIDDEGRFTAPVTPWVGLRFDEANPLITDALRSAGALVRAERYAHDVPHCWRSDTPLIQKAVSSWFIDVPAIKDRMLELNQGITWVPEHVRDGSFGKWLDNARPWSISRNRYFGSPVPIWKSDDPAHPRIDVYGSLDEIERDFGVRPTDLHRPAIDELVRPNPDDPTGRSTMRRVTDVLDCWVESGSMPFAQHHYPFENREEFDRHPQADFVCEYVGQTRGWFYTLLVMSTALFDRAPFRSCLAHGVLLGDDGQKLSKKLGNYPDPVEVFDEVGSDAMRWALLSSAAVRGGDVMAARGPMEEAVRQVILPLWNTWSFLSLHGRETGRRGRLLDLADPATWPAEPLDRFVVGATAALADTVAEALEAYDISGACAAVTAHLDALTNWYIRRSRKRFATGEQAAFDSLHTALEALCRIAAPLLPLTTDVVHRGLTGCESVHLTDWPEATVDEPTRELLITMARVREVCSAVAGVRATAGVPVRQPLARLTVVVDDPEVEAHAELIGQEGIVQVVVFEDDLAAPARTVATAVPARLGPRLGDRAQAVIRAIRQGEVEWVDGVPHAAGQALRDDELTVRLEPKEPEGAALLPGGAGVVVLDLALDEDLVQEGMARTFSRMVNDLRRERGFARTDRITLVVEPGGPVVAAALEARRSSVTTETRAATFRIVPDLPAGAEGPGPVVTLDDGSRVLVAVAASPSPPTPHPHPSNGARR